VGDGEWQQTQQPSAEAAEEPALEEHERLGQESGRAQQQEEVLKQESVQAPKAQQF